MFHFYDIPDLDQLQVTLQAPSSSTFAMGEHDINITSAPTWFVPAHMKLDNDLLLLQGDHAFAQLVGSEVITLDGTTRWVDRQILRNVLWPELITTVNIVDIIDPGATVCTLQFVVLNFRRKSIVTKNAGADPIHSGVQLFEVTSDMFRKLAERSLVI